MSEPIENRIGNGVRKYAKFAKEGGAAGHFQVGPGSVSIDANKPNALGRTQGKVIDKAVDTFDSGVRTGAAAVRGLRASLGI